MRPRLCSAGIAYTRSRSKPRACLRALALIGLGRIRAILPANGTDDMSRCESTEYTESVHFQAFVSARSEDLGAPLATSHMLSQDPMSQLSSCLKSANEQPS